MWSRSSVFSIKRPSATFILYTLSGAELDKWEALPSSRHSGDWFVSHCPFVKFLIARQMYPPYSLYMLGLYAFYIEFKEPLPTLPHAVCPYDGCCFESEHWELESVCDLTVMREKEGQVRPWRIIWVTGYTIPTPETDNAHFSVLCTTPRIIILHMCAFECFYFLFALLKNDHYLSVTAIYCGFPFCGWKPGLPQHLAVFATILLNHCYCCETCSVSGGNFIVDVVMTVMK